jgi:RNA polymerase sigma-70 factor, ECF subfamily
VSFAIISMTETSVPNARGDQFVDLLTRIAASKDRLAFAAVFDHFAPRVKSFMMRKGSNAEQAEDLVQETMIAVWSKAAMFSTDKGSVSTWIFTIARNLRIDKLRRERSQLYTDLEDFDAPDMSAGAEESLGRSQEDNQVSIALAQIPAEQRDLLILSFVEDVPQSEIAIKLGIPLGTVKSRMRLGYQRLRKILETVN